MEYLTAFPIQICIMQDAKVSRDKNFVRHGQNQEKENPDNWIEYFPFDKKSTENK